MAKTRLNRGSRDAATEYIEAHLTTPNEQKRYDKAIKKAYAVISKAVDKKYPPEDMAVLAKYNLTRGDTCGAVVTPDGKVVGFDLPSKYLCERSQGVFRRSEYPSFIVPQGRCQIRNLPTTKAGGDAVEEFDASISALKEARASKLRDYKAVIEGSRYIEDLVDVVPALADTLEPFKSANTGLSVSGEILDRLASDTLRTPVKEDA